MSLNGKEKTLNIDNVKKLESDQRAVITKHNSSTNTQHDEKFLEKSKNNGEMITKLSSSTNSKQYTATNKKRGEVIRTFETTTRNGRVSLPRFGKD